VTAVTDAPSAEIGKSRRRKEDQHLITGRTTWTDNMSLPGMVHLAILRSPIANWGELGPGDAKLIGFVVPREL